MEIRLIGLPADVRAGLNLLRLRMDVRSYSEEFPSRKRPGQVLVYVTAGLLPDPPTTEDVDA